MFFLTTRVVKFQGWEGASFSKHRRCATHIKERAKRWRNHLEAFENGVTFVSNLKKLELNSVGFLQSFLDFKNNSKLVQPCKLTFQTGVLFVVFDSGFLK
jgi:hypothetical protein